MKFSRHLATHLTPEWYPQYINYNKMKKILYKVLKQVEQGSVEDFYKLRKAGTDMFIAYCQRELIKIQAFYMEKISEAKRKLTSLIEEVGIDNQDVCYITNTILRSSDTVAILADKRRLRALKLAFSELYLLLVLIQNYQSLNCTGFRKILKKHDKLFNTDLGAQWNKEQVLTSYFSQDKTSEQLIEQVEHIFTIYLENGDKPAAMKALRVPPLDQPIALLTSFRVGILLGMISVLFPIIILSANWLYKVKTDIPWKIATRLYRSIFLIIFQLCLTGINLLGWSRSGVNHVLIFELDPRRHLNYQQLLEVGLFFLLLWQFSIIAFLISSYVNKYSLLNPLILFAIICIFVTNPTRFLYWSARKWLLCSFMQVFLPCMQPVEFRHFWLGDQFTSQGLAFYDTFYFLYFYAFQYSWKESNSDQSLLLRPTLDDSLFFLIVACVFSLLPHIARFSQCIRRYRDDKMLFPHLVNAGKYFTSFPLVIMNVIGQKVVEDTQLSSKKFNYIFTIFAFIESTYKLTWDLKMDWGLLDGEFNFIRESTVYSPLVLYYFAIIENCILRFTWLLKIAFSKKMSDDNIYTEICFCLIEIVRRFIWNFFRLENEHLNNCGNFRAVRDISIRPIKQSSNKDDNSTQNENVSGNYDCNDANDDDDVSSLVKSIV